MVAALEAPGRQKKHIAMHWRSISIILIKKFYKKPLLTLIRIGKNEKLYRSFVHFFYQILDWQWLFENNLGLFCRKTGFFFQLLFWMYALGFFWQSRIRKEKITIALFLHSMDIKYLFTLNRDFRKKIIRYKI